MSGWSRKAAAGTVLACAAWLFAGCSGGGSTSATSQPSAEEQQVTVNLANFDDLDFNVFTNQKWDELHKSHADSIVVHWPDGHTTQGIQRHIQDLEAMFVWAPDTRITAHPIKFGKGDWTCVTGVFEGTFTKPMPIGNGKTLPATNKAYKLDMCTIGHWKNGTMDEEYLFWDNGEFRKQIGLAK